MNEHDADTPYKRSDTEEVRSSNLLTPTIHSQPRGIVSGLLFWFTPGPHIYGNRKAHGHMEGPSPDSSTRRMLAHNKGEDGADLEGLTSSLLESVLLELTLTTKELDISCAVLRGSSPRDCP